MLSHAQRTLLIGITAVGVILLAAVLIATRTSHGAGDAAAHTSSEMAMGTALQHPRTAPTLRLIDEHGHATTLGALRGKWVVLAPTMTLCQEVCPMTTGAFIALTQKLRRASMSGRVAVVEVTVDPSRDTPPRLRAYRRLTATNFTLLTGTPQEIHQFWKFFGVFYQRVPERNPPDIDWLTHKPETFDIEHTDGLFIVDPQGRERVADEGMPNVENRLSPALRKLLDEEGHQNLAHPQLPWTAAQVLDDLHRLGA